MNHSELEVHMAELERTSEGRELIRLSEETIRYYASMWANIHSAAYRLLLFLPQDLQQGLKPHQQETYAENRVRLEKAMSQMDQSAAEIAKTKAAYQDSLVALDRLKTTIKYLLDEAECAALRRPHDGSQLDEDLEGLLMSVKAFRARNVK